MTNYSPAPPSSPTDLIVTAGAPHPGTLRDTLRSYADRLATAGALTDITPRDARTVATTIAWDLVHGDEPTALRDRAAAITDGSWGGWDDPVGVARALHIAAARLDEW